MQPHWWSLITCCGCCQKGPHCCLAYPIIRNDSKSSEIIRHPQTADVFLEDAMVWIHSAKILGLVLSHLGPRRTTIASNEPCNTYRPKVLYNLESSSAFFNLFTSFWNDRLVHCWPLTMPRNAESFVFPPRPCSWLTSFLGNKHCQQFNGQ